MNNQEIAAALRAGSAKYWPNESFQCKGMWFHGRARCFVQMLADSLRVRSGTDVFFNVAGKAILKAAGITPISQSITGHLVILNEGPTQARPFHELKALVAAAADLLDGGEQPAIEEPAVEQPAIDTPAEADPVEMPPPNQPAPEGQPLPTSITQMLTIKPGDIVGAQAREKEYA